MKLFLLIFSLMSILLLVGCTTTAPTTLLVKYYDKDGKIISTYDASNQLSAQAIILPDIPSNAVTVSYVISVTNNGNTNITTHVNRATFTGEYE